MSRAKSDSAFKSAKRVIPGGVNSPVRAFGAVGGKPLFVRHGHGSRIVDLDGKSYIDFVMSWGPLILGHAPGPVVRAVRDAAERGMSYGAPTRGEVEMAGTLVKAIPSLKMVRLVNSGTEAAMSALRVARAATGRDGLIKFEGCYHGHADAFLVKGGSGLATFGISSSAGVPRTAVSHTYVVPYNNLEAVEAVMRKHGRSIAAIIVEPIAANMGVILPEPGFLQGLRKICTRYGSLLIADEVVTGFRLRFGGVQDELKVRPDLTLLGKIIGGGMPLGAFGGASGIMRELAPLGPAYQAGTLSGNPLAVAAGRAALGMLSKRTYADLDKKGRALAYGLHQAADRRGVDVTINRAGSMLTIFFTGRMVTNFKTANTTSAKQYRLFFNTMLDHGVYLPPSPFEAWMVSAAHTDEDIEETLRAADAAFIRVSKAR